ncbi:very-long-chain (3R)-3-hydroxyacyl-CoA dehydratase 2-like isoform X1 [Lethenteron reissneri]|uniref:very-long-chain (3R)-3-hydroxyacyl-CoA dehydratase 2-like isoform X1 n=2 Tax=Lethenteron reissneri TaxID=7753 RepID=UPI002AB7B254|nr:very-long-chain (3R)-3-hydroxyacyl-CoA dehydratase 2-like isoform X1 [Lethenteron reissneri]
MVPGEAGAAVEAASLANGDNKRGATAAAAAVAPVAPAGSTGVATAWLIFYNVAMTAGWIVMSGVMLKHALLQGTVRGVYRSVEKPLKLFQTASVLEVLYSFFGIVPSSVTLKAFHVSSRIFLLWAVVHSVREVQNEESTLLFIVTWMVTEIVRYSFYTFTLLQYIPYCVKWARYSFFIVLYPLGVLGELLTIHAALPHVQRKGLYSITMPNAHNFSFDYHTFLIAIMIAYVPGALGHHSWVWRIAVGAWKGCYTDKVKSIRLHSALRASVAGEAAGAESRAGAQG